MRKPSEAIRFVAKTVFEETFVVAARIGHPFLAAPSLERYAEAKHVLASVSD